MPNIKDARWYLFLFTDIEKTNLLKVYHFDTIKEMSFVLDIEAQTISNYYHELIKSRGVLDYCKIYQFTN